MRRLVLVGGGHAHLSVLSALRKDPLAIDVVLVTPSSMQTYSGMVPGWISGRYNASDCLIDLAKLAEAAGVKLMLSQVTGMDANRRLVTLSNGDQLAYDYLSVDIGSTSNLSSFSEKNNHVVSLKPIGEFMQRWPEVLAQASKANDFKLCVIGGGAAGVEIAFAAQHAFATHAPGANVTLVSSKSGVLPGHAVLVASQVRQLLLQRGIAVHESHATIANNKVLLGNGERLQPDIIIAATGSSPASWLASSNLALDKDGYISVDKSHRSISHQNVFAAGDVCSRTDVIMTRSGVHAVFAGPVLAHNLYSSVRGGTFIQYRPRKKSLYILATGPKHAIASWGRLSLAGRWVWYWKNWIDRRFMKKYNANLTIGGIKC